MRVLVTWGSKLGGTEGIARILGEALQQEGFEVSLLPASEVRDLSGYDAAIIGGALYANRWHRHARQVVARNVAALRRIPVWLFSSGPLDDSAERKEIRPTTQVEVLMERIGARGHTTFGGRLRADARGFPASSMAKTHAGDWRNPERIRAWAMELSAALPDARPGIAIDHPGRALPRLLAYGAWGWALCELLIVALSKLASSGLALTLHAVLAPLIFAALARAYFRARGARDPLPTALSFVALVVLLDAVIVAPLLLRSFDLLTSFAGFWLPMLLIFGVTWLVGLLMSTRPWTERAETPDAPGLGGTA